MILKLDRNQTVSFNKNLEGNTIRCDDGLAWVTVTGDPSDYFLGAGEEMMVIGKGKAVIMAWEKASIRICKKNSADTLVCSFQHQESTS